MCSHHAPFGVRLLGLLVILKCRKDVLCYRLFCKRIMASTAPSRFSVSDVPKLELDLKEDDAIQGPATLQLETGRYCTTLLVYRQELLLADCALYVRGQVRKWITSLLRVQLHQLLMWTPIRSQ